MCGPIQDHAISDFQATTGKTDRQSDRYFIDIKEKSLQTYKVILLIIMTCTIFYILSAGMQWVLGLYKCTISDQLFTVPLVNYRCESWGGGGGGGCSMSGEPPLK